MSVPGIMSCRLQISRKNDLARQTEEVRTDPSLIQVVDLNPLELASKRPKGMMESLRRERDKKDKYEKYKCLR